jgi:hypothetical protein
MTNTNKTTQMIVGTQAALKEAQGVERIALFQSDGSALVLDDISATGATVIMTGYAAGSAADVDSNDTVNEAVGKVEAVAKTHDTGAQVLLTGYSAQSAGNVAAADTVNHAIAKLEARIVALEGA